MKYPVGMQIVSALYDNTSDNPFLSAMPDLMGKDEFLSRIRAFPALPPTFADLSPEKRRTFLAGLSELFIPMGFMYHIYDILVRGIRTTYTTKISSDELRLINALFTDKEGFTPHAIHADSGAILGVPGIGKTSTIQRGLSLLPQVIEHLSYRGRPFFFRQVLYLYVQCPSDCSVKTLAFNILAALDRAIGSNYVQQATALRAAAVSSVATQVKILCTTHHVGIILIDEIQHAVDTAYRIRQVKPLMKFLVELTNDTGTATWFVGTPQAEELFTSTAHLERRTRGIRLLPLRPDEAFRNFLKQLWPYQYTQKLAPLTTELANKLYDYSGGVPAYIIKIFQESQALCLMQSQSCIDAKIIKKTIDILAIHIPKTYSGGTYLSDFEPVSISETDTNSPSPESETPSAPADKSLSVPQVARLYANPRGRKANRRDSNDLIVALKSGVDMIQFLQRFGLYQEWPAEAGTP